MVKLALTLGLIVNSIIRGVFLLGAFLANIVVIVCCIGFLGAAFMWIRTSLTSWVKDAQKVEAKQRVTYVG